MYSQHVSKLLEKASANVGDRVRITASKQEYEGLLMPRSHGGKEDCVVLKLDSGYNIGVDAKGAKVERLEARKKAGQEKIPAKRIARPQNRAPIMILATGGTIASKVDYETGAVHPTLDANEILGAYPRLDAAGPIRSKSMFTMLSEDMRPKNWSQIAHEIKGAFDDGATGVVVAHGTDTMGYTAAALSYALGNLPGPVVLTGAQRSPDRGSSDAGQNLFCSSMAARANFSGVAVCMHASTSDGMNSLLIGTRTRKTHSSGRWAFRSIGAPPFGKVMADTGQVLIEGGAMLARDDGRKVEIEAKFSENAHFAWIYPGISKKTVSSWSDYDGVLLAGTGLGHAPLDALNPDSKNSLLKELSELIESGVLVGMASQCFGGRVLMQTYSTGRMLQDIGVVGHGADWLPETAYVKMCWALARAKDAKKAAEIMMTPLAGDITPYSVVGEDTL